MRTWNRRVWLILFSFFLPLPLQAVKSSCPVYEGNFRVDSPQSVKRFESICELHGNVGIFTDGIQKLTFPNLKSAGVINIEAYGLQAISFPKLESTHYLYLSGPDLEVAEFPNLQVVNDVFHVQSRRLKFLNLPKLGRVDGTWSITGNPSLEFVFADDIYSIGELQIANNPMLKPGTADALQIALRILTPEEQQYIEEQREEMRELKHEIFEHLINQPPMPPTGHPTEYGSIGFYYHWYPRMYWDYWETIGPWGFWGYYGIQ